MGEALMEETIRKSSILDWTGFLCLAISLWHMEIFNAVASEKRVPSKKLAVCHMMILEDVSKLRNLPRGQGQPVSWILVYDYCAMGILYTLPEHRGKGYAKVLISTMAKRLHTQDYPVYCFIEEENLVSYRLFKNMGFTEDPTYRQAWVAFNEQISGW